MFVSLDVNHPLIRAILRGDIEAIRSMNIDSEWLGPTVAINPEYGIVSITPLMVAAGCHGANGEIVCFFLEKGSDPRAVDRHTRSALGHAVEGLPQIFFDWKLDPESEEAFKAGGDLERIQILVEAGCDVTALAVNGATLPAAAARRGEAEWLRYLLDRGAPLYPDPNSFEEPERWWKSEFYALDTERFDVETSPYYSWKMPLHAAAEAGSEECCELLLDLGVPIEKPDSDGRTALFYAWTPEVARYLIQKGAHIDHTSAMSNVLEQHLEEGRYDVARALLEAGAQIEKSKWGTNVAHGFAGVHMDPVALKLLVEFGADLRAPYHNNGTFLHNACWQGDGNGGRPDEVTAETVQYLIDQGVPVNAQNNYGCTALHEAVHGDWDSPTSTRLLLENSADPNIADSEGMTPLMTAASYGAPECVELLLKHGADLNLKDNEGKTALDHAAKNLDSWRRIASPSPKGKKDHYQREKLEEVERSYEAIRQASNQ